MSTSRRLLSRLLAAFLATVLALLVGEGVARMLFPYDEGPVLAGSGDTLYRADPELTYAMRPSADARFRRHELSTRVETNAFGYRDDEFASPPSTDEFVIAGLGDSYGFGHGVEEEEGFYRVAEDLLREHYPEVRIHNLCTSGYSQRQHLAQIDLARELGARLAVVAVSTCNDVLENGGILSRRLDEGGLEHVVSGRRGESRKKVVEAAAWVARNSRLASTVAVRVLGVGRQGAGSTPVYDQMRLEPALDETKRAFQETSSLLAELERACSAAGLGLAFVSIPTIFEASDAELERTLAPYGHDPAGFDRRKVTRFYLSFCEERGVPMLDLSERLPAVADDLAACYYPKDRHFTPLGHRLAAEELAAFLLPLIEAELGASRARTPGTG